MTHSLNPFQEKYLHHQQGTGTQNIVKERKQFANSIPLPRRCMTSYAFFWEKFKEEYKKTKLVDDISYDDVSRECLDRWNTMLDEDKKFFYELAKNDKKRYDYEMKVLIALSEKKQKPSEMKRKLSELTPYPQDALSAFFWYCNDERGKVKEENPEFSYGEIVKELGNRWSHANREVRKKYKAMEKQDIVRYQEEMTAYNSVPHSKLRLDENITDNSEHNIEDTTS